MPNNSRATALDNLPESMIVVWEILVRLPPKDALRCHAVRKSWRCGASTRDFLLEHHRRQPSLPIIKQCGDTEHGPAGVAAIDDPRLVVFHHDGTTNQKLRPVLRYANPPKTYASLQLHLHDCRDGLLIISDTVGAGARGRFFYICNPTTRQCALLPQLFEDVTQLFTTGIAGLYLHHPSGDYRVLYRVLYICWSGRQNINADFYIMTVGSDEPRRLIGKPPPSSSPPSVQQAVPSSTKIAPVLHRGGLHWNHGRYDKHYGAITGDIMVFDTATETFRWLGHPTQAPLGLLLLTLLLEMDGALALFSVRDGIVIDVFVMQDYENEVWALQHQIDLSATMTKLPQLQLTMALVNKRELLIDSAGLLLHCDIDGKVLDIIRSPNTILLTTHLLQESIVPLPLFEMQQGTAGCEF